MKSKNSFVQKYLFIGWVSLCVLGCTTTAAEMAQNSGQSPSPDVKRAPANHSWGGYHWARTTPQFTLKLGDNLSASWKSYLTLASSDWNSPQLFGASSTPILTAVTAGKSSQKHCQMVAGTTQVCNNKYGNNGWLGLASINIVNGEHITQGSVKLNDTYFNTSKYNNVNEKLHVVCQEVAHTFGLDHQSTDGSSLNTCMDYYSNTGTNATNTASTRPNLHDFDELMAIYNHPDATTTVASLTAMPVAADEVTEDPETWGEFIKNNNHRHGSYYGRVHKDGSQTLTHVFWTNEQAARCENCDHRYER